METRITRVLGVLVAASALAACGGSSEEEANAVVGRAEATSMAEQMLSALADDDYLLFSESFSPELKQSLPEENYAELRRRISKTSGRWLSIDDVALRPDPGGYVFYEIATTFEKESVDLMIWFPPSARLMQGVMITSPKLVNFDED